MDAPMHARTTTFRGRPDAVEAGVAHVEDEVLPALEAMPGCVGMSLLVQRESGVLVATTAWETQEHMIRTGPVVAPMRDRAEQLVGGRPEVREWEIAVVHRTAAAPAGARARVTWTRVPPPLVDQQLYVFKVGTLPQLEDLPGFCSASLLLDRTRGTAALAVVYESAEMLEQSRRPASELRTASVDHLGATVLDVAELEVAIARLRVPETV